MMQAFSRYPTLDLHGEYAITVYTPIHSFLMDNVKLKNEYVILIHGKGSGKLKNEVQHILKNEKCVKKFHVDPWNLGQTIVMLDIKK